MSGASSRPVLVAPGEWKTIQQAAHYVKRSPDTIRRWIKQHGISRQSCPGAPHEVSVIALEMVRHGDLDALELLRRGRREDADVRRYLELAGVTCG